MVLKEKWMASMYEQMKLVYPDRKKNEILSFLEKKFDKSFKDVECTAYNNYEEEIFDTTLSKIVEWKEAKDPICTESGTFFKKHSECFNPNGIILQKKLDDRKIAKGKKFDYEQKAINAISKEDRDNFMSRMQHFDLTQNRLKKIANSEYGVSGMRSSFMYNLACASTTTLKGQHLISTAYSAFENFLQDNVLIYDMDECMVYIKNIISEKDKWELNIRKYVSIEITEDMLYNRLLRKFKYPETCNEKILRKVIHNLPYEFRERIYYKNNLYEFISNSEYIQNRIQSIMLDGKNFLDPVKPPSTIKKDLSKINDALLEFVHYNHAIYDKVFRIQTEYRKAVRIIDTDSNFVDLSHFEEFIEKNIMSGYTEVYRTNKDGYSIIRRHSKPISEAEKEKKMFKAVNTMAHVLGNMIARVLKRYVRECGVEDDAPGNVSMKNEFLYTEVLNTTSKKHYMAKIKLQEGRYFPKYKPDVKGMEWNKRSYASDYAMNFNRNLVFNDILNENTDMNTIINKLNEYESIIHDSVMNGEFRFLTEKKVSTEDAYSDPMSIGQYKATYVWNSLYPEDEIELPGRIYQLKVNLDKPKDFAKLSVDDPEMFERLMNLFETNLRIKKSGITSIAIPKDGAIPEWIKPYINMDEIIESNLKLSFPMLESLGTAQVYKTKSSKFFSNIIQI